MDNFLIGMIAMALVAAGLFFLRFWRDTGDRLFLIFAIAFWLLALTRFTLIVTYASAPRASTPPVQEEIMAEPSGEETRTEAEEEVKKESERYVSVYWVRLAAFLLILIAIIDKNLTRRDRPAQTT